MYVQHYARGDYARRIAYLAALLLSGCGSGLGTGGIGGLSSSLNLSTVGLDDESTFYETDANEGFESAELVEVSSQSRVIRGSIDDAADVDIYDFGAVVPGDRIIVNTTTAATLSGAVGLFDGNGTELLVNDHRNVYLGRVEPFVDVVIREASPSCFLAVTATPGYGSSGDYALTASRQEDAASLTPEPDVVLMVFDGGERVRIGSRDPINVPAFDAAAILDRYAGETQTMMDQVVEMVRDDYAAYDITILSTHEGDTFASGMTRLYFGTYDPALLGVAEGVDEFNATTQQNAIVFTDTFAAFSPLSPSTAQMSQALANVASHEIGHLLGLVHTEDPLGIMDVTASLNELLRDQALTRSPIYSAVFPVGYQDAVTYLLDVLGGDEQLAMAARPDRTRRTHRSILDGERSPARKGWRLSSCCVEETPPLPTAESQ